eukprot:Colp12_sorted_trinity150504_noHs@702
MPTIGVKRDLLFEALGRTYTDAEFDELCFEFGIELDDVTTEKRMLSKEHADAKNKDELAEASEDIIYKIEIPANRYDLLCLEGLTRALLVFQEKAQPPKYKVVKAEKPQRLVVKPETGKIRPHVVAAVLRDVRFTEASYDSFIDLQEKLHQNICRKRTLVAIGTHDLDTVQGPFTYEALPPSDIKFKPLSQKQEYTANQLMELYEKDSHLRHYLPIIRDSPVYPVIYDSNRTVLSMPPIINGEHSKITLNTRNVFIECTATDLTKANIVLNTVVAMFAQYCKEPFTIEEVEVTHADGSKAAYPNLDSRFFDVGVDYITSRIGIKETPENVARLLHRMCLPATLSSDKSKVTVEVPPTRSDVLHACDVMEDVAIAYGYNNVPKRIPGTNTIAAQFPINKLSDLLRINIAMAGFSEVLNFALCSHDENFKFLNKTDDGNTAVKIANPKTLEFQVARTTLLPGALKTVECNRKMPLPIKVFEISDIVVKDASSDTGARNHRHLCALILGKTPNFETLHGLLDRVMQLLNIPSVEEGAPAGYYLVPSNDATFFPGQQAEIFYKQQKIGIMGVLHPTVLAAYQLPLPASALEITIEPFL